MRAFYLKACIASLSPYERNGREWNQRLQTASSVYDSVFVLHPLSHFFLSAFVFIRRASILDIDIDI